MHQQNSELSGRTTEAAQTAKQGAQDVAGVAREQGRQVASEVGHQVRTVAQDLRGSVAGQASRQNDRLAQGLRTMADHLEKMAGQDDDTPAGQVVRRLGQSGRQTADYLERQGPEGVLDDVQEFARRRPGTFLLAAAAAGFLVGRLGRTAVSATRSDGGSGDEPAGTGGGVYRTGSVPAYGEEAVGGYGGPAPVSATTPVGTPTTASGPVNREMAP